MTAETPELKYAQRPNPNIGRRRIFRWMFFVLFLILLGGLAWRFGPRAWRQARLLYWQGQCMAYAPPPDRVVYDDGPNAKCQWQGKERYEWSPGRLDAFAYSLPVPFRMRWPDQGRHSAGAAFLHARKRPDGQERLVWIQVFRRPIGWTDFFAWVSRPISWSDGPVTTFASARYPSFHVVTFDEPDRTVVFAGQADSIDQSHFTIDIEVAGVRHTMDAWLTDKDEVTYRPRDGRFNSCRWMPHLDPEP